MKKVMIFKKILDIQEEIPAILKEKEFKNAQGKIIYKFRGIDDLYNAVNPLFKKHRVFMTPEVLSHESTERVTGSGSVLFYEKLEVKYKLFAEDGSFVDAVTRGIGMDTGDKAANKAMSVAQRNVLTQMFTIPTEEPKDPENNGHEVITEYLNEIQELTAKAEKMGDLEILYNSYSDLHSSDAFKNIFREAKSRIKKGGQQ